VWPTHWWITLEFFRCCLALAKPRVLDLTTPPFSCYLSRFKRFNCIRRQKSLQNRDDVGVSCPSPALTTRFNALQYDQVEVNERSVVATMSTSLDANCAQTEPPNPIEEDSSPTTSLQALPNEIIIKIIKYLSVPDVICFALVCKKFYNTVLAAEKIDILNDLQLEFYVRHMNLWHRNRWPKHADLTRQLYTWLGRRCIFCGQAIGCLEQSRPKRPRQLSLHDNLAPSHEIDWPSYLSITEIRLSATVHKVEKIIRPPEYLSVRSSRQLNRLFSSFYPMWRKFECVLRRIHSSYRRFYGYNAALKRYQECWNEWADVRKFLERQPESQG
jgi:hypothetical protein